MELLKQVLIKAMHEDLTDYAGFELGFEKLVENRCYKALNEIIKIVRNPDYDDPECFKRIELIVCALEKLGTHAADRHDFS